MNSEREIKKWDGSDIKNMHDKTVVITGATSGLGLEAARVLANKGARVIMAVRNKDKGQAACDLLKAGNKNVKVTVMQLDLADMNSIRTFAAEFKSQFSGLDVLINNAGVMAPPYSKTKDGFELQIGTNHFGHFLLTGLLLDNLEQSPAGRIVNISSNAHKMGNIDFSDINWERRNYKPWSAYGDSKLANLYFTYELKRRLMLKGSKIIAAAAHPGYTDTDLQRHSGFFKFLNKILAQSVTMGTLPGLYAAASPEAVSGAYYGPVDWAGWRGYPKKTESNRLSYDENNAKKLWELSEKLTGIKYL